MIKGISSIGPYIQVNGGNPNPTYFNHSAPSAGIVRFFNNNLEVYDGSAWVQLANSYASVEMTPDAIAILSWGRDKMAEEARIKDLAEQHPGIKDLQQKLEIMIALVNQDKNSVA
jgi:hypothetical protein